MSLSPVLLNLGRLMMLVALAVPIAWALGGMDWWFDGFTCAEGPMANERPCRFGEKAWATLLLDGALFLGGMVLWALNAPARSGALFTLDLSARRSARRARR